MSENYPQRLMCIANRLPLIVRESESGVTIVPSSGGLVSALTPILRRGGGIWIGADGVASTKEESHTQLIKDFSSEIGFTLEPVSLSKDEYEEFYQGFSNRIIWPLFHDLQSRCSFNPEYWETYKIVNKKFAERAANACKENDIIWVNDYHLIGLGRELRSQNLTNSISFFLHIPFPAPDIFKKLPWREEIMQSLMAYGVIGLQTKHDVANILSCIADMTDFKITQKSEGYSVKHTGGEVYIQHFPISIDTEDFLSLAELPEVKARAAEIKQSVNVDYVAVCVDRLDYTKGITHRIKAFERLLQTVPELRRKVALLQVLVPSREEVPEYITLRDEVEKLVSQVNGSLAEPGWIPVQHFFRSINREELVALYLSADVGLVTPLKDGMNLVAKEYCVVQTDGDAVLILSEFAGAAEELSNFAITVNPYDIERTADALRAAFMMPKSERAERMSRIQDIIKAHDVYAWADDFLKKAAGQHAWPQIRAVANLTEKFRRLISVFDL